MCLLYGIRLLQWDLLRLNLVHTATYDHRNSQERLRRVVSRLVSEELHMNTS
jgi:hypothetical protein